MIHKMDSNRIGYVTDRLESSANVDLRPDTFVKRGIFPNDKEFWCLVCNDPIHNVLAIPLHIGRNKHCSRFESVHAGSKEVDGQFTCMLCEDYQVTDWPTFLIHFNEQKHFKEVREMKREASKNGNSQISKISFRLIVTNQIIKHEHGIFFCYCCQQLITGANLIRNHISSEKHKTLQESRNEVIYPGKLKEKFCRIIANNGLYHEHLKTFNCSLCKTLLTETETCLEHINFDIEHLRNIIKREDTDHQSLLQNCKANENPQYTPPTLSQDDTSESFTEIMEENSIEGPSGTSRYDCKLCLCILSGQKAILTHVSGMKHKQNMMAMSRADDGMKSASQSKETTEGLANTWKSEPQHLKHNVQHIYEMNPERLQIMRLSCEICFLQTSSTIYCLICKKSVASKLQTFYEHIRNSAHTMYLAEAEQNNKRFEYLNQFSKLTLAKEFMQEGPGDSILCFACDSSIRNNNIIISEHINRDSHRERKQLWNEKMGRILQEILVEMKGTWCNIQEYWCQPCDIVYGTESHFAEHMKSEEHSNCLHRIGEFQNRLVYDSCVVCARLWLGFSGIYTQHCSQPMHKYRVQNENLLLDNLPNQAKTNVIEPDQFSTSREAKDNMFSKCSEDTVKFFMPNANPTAILTHASGEQHKDTMAMTKIDDNKLKPAFESDENKFVKLNSFRASNSANCAHKYTEPQVNPKRNSQLNITKVCRELELLKQTLIPKIKSNSRRISSAAENITGVENPLHKLSITDLCDQNSTKLLQNQPNSTDQIPRHMKSRRRDATPKTSRAFDPKYLKIDMQHIYEMNPEKLRIINLSCQLCFPTTSDMIYCLVCERSVTLKLQTFYEHICSCAHIEYLADVEKNDKHFINYPDQFSDLTIAKEFMQEGQEETIQCFACDLSMQNDDIVIRTHINKDSHKARKLVWEKQMQSVLENILTVMDSTWYNIQKYWCEPCDMEYNTEFHFAEHMDSKEHRTSLMKKRAFKNEIIYDSCVPCAVLWLGSSDTYMQHCNQPMHKYLIQSEDFLTCELPKHTIILLENAEAEVTILIELSNQVSTIQKAKSDTLLKCLEDTVKPICPNAKAYPFGSRVSGLGFPDSDLDVFLDCGAYNGNNASKNYQERLIITVEQCFYANQQSWEIEETLVTTRTPIIKLRHRDTELSCDVSFKNGLSVENTKLLKCFIDNYPPCRKLMLFLKKWLHLCNLAGSQYISNYATCWYVIFYLQSKMIVPSVASLIAKENKSKIIDGWETGISRSFDAGGQESTFTKLLQGFFTFYANFDYRNSVACPILGRTVLKQDFTELDLLPEEMAPYINHVVTKNVKGMVELFRIDSEMCIQDPYDLSHNLTKAVQKFTLNRFKRLCAASASLLNNIPEHSYDTLPSQRCQIL